LIFQHDLYLKCIFVQQSFPEYLGTSLLNRPSCCKKCYTVCWQRIWFTLL